MLEPRCHLDQKPTTSPLHFDSPARKASTHRLLFFVGGLLLALGGLESLVRANSSLFEAVSDRAHTKIAMLETHPRAQFIFLGSSRTEGTVSPVLVTRALQKSVPELGEVSGFNAAFAGSNLDSLNALVSRFDFPNNLRLVVIEVSVPQLFIPPAPQEESKSAATTIEDKLAEAARHIYFIRYRKSFLSDSLGRVFELLIFAPHLSGWETKAKDQIASWLGREEQSAVGFDETLWIPDFFMPSALAQTLDARNEMLVERLVSLAHEFHKHGIKVTFVVPPVKRDFATPEKDVLRPLFSEVARRTQSELWNFAVLPLSDSLFRDESHLGDIGRAHYSQALAMQLARILKSE